MKFPLGIPTKGELRCDLTELEESTFDGYRVIGDFSGPYSKRKVDINTVREDNTT